MPTISLPNNWVPRPYQREVFDAFRKGVKRAVLVWHRQCLEENTTVTMADGSWKYIKDIRPGDSVLTWTEEVGYAADEVTGAWFAGEKPVVEVKAAGLPGVKATLDHRFKIQTQGHAHQWKQAQEIAPKGEFGSSDQTVVLPHTPAFLFPPANDLRPDTAAFLGYLVSDGSTTPGQQCKFTNNEPNVIAVVEHLARLHGGIPVLRPKNNGWDVGITNGRKGGGEVPNPVKEMCRAEGILTQKNTKEIPSSLWGATDECVIRFLAAVIDSDGSLYLHKRVVSNFRHQDEVATGDVKIHVGLSDDLMWGYFWLLKRLGVTASIVRKGKTCRTVRITSSEAVSKFLLLVTPFLAHKTKQAVAKQILAETLGYTPRRVYNGVYAAAVSVTNCGETARTYDIETKKHHSFFANGYLVHNSGKDDFALHYTATQVMQRPGSYWHLLPLANQCRKVVWDAVNPMTGKKRIDEAFPVELRESTRSQDMVIKFKNGSVWQLVGSDNFDSLVGSTPVGLVFSEYAVANPLAWTYLRPILAANGGWAMFISTPRGKNHLHGLYELAKNDPDWFGSIITASDSGVLSQETLDRELREMIAERGPDEGLAKFKQEYYCSFEVTTEGSFYGSILDKIEADGQITSVPYDPMLPVVTSWDLGMKDPTNVWFFQHYGMQIRVIDCFATTGEGVDAYARMLKEKQYNYDQHIMPHDIRVREIGTNGKTRYEMLQGLGVYPITVCRKIPVYDGINAVRATLPRMWFDKKKCATGLAALRYYHKEWDDTMKRFRDNPEKDWSNHFSDSFRYYCVGYQQKPKVKTVSQIMSERSYVGAW